MTSSKRNDKPVTKINPEIKDMVTLTKILSELWYS